MIALTAPYWNLLMTKKNIKMETSVIKKEMVSTLKSELELHVSVRESLESLINEYIEFIEKNVYSEFYEYFGIGVAGSHSQFGSHYGFLVNKCDDYNGNYEYYAVPGNGYCIANDFNARVSGSNFIEMKEFAAKITEYVKNGIKQLESANEETQKIINTITFN